MTAPLPVDVSVSTLFTEHDLLARPSLAAACGFASIELWWPFDTPEPTDRDAGLLTHAVREAGVDVVLMNLDAGDVASGERGLASIPGHAKRFRANVEVAVELAEQLGCKLIHAVYGNRVDGLDPEEQEATAVENLAFAAKAADRVGARVLIEAMNPIDCPAYPLTTTREALRVIDRIAQDTGAAVGLLYDVYHAQRSEGNLIPTINALSDRIAHVQIADAPLRTEPGTGEIAYERVLRALAASGYRGSVGLEYLPSGRSEQSFGWLNACRSVVRA